MNRTKALHTKASKTVAVNTSVRADMLRYGRSVGAVTHSHDQPLTYRALQRACKAAGVSAKGSSAVLRKRLWAAEFGHLEPNPTPLTRRQRQAQQAPAPVQVQDVSQDTSQDTSFDYAAAYACDTAVTYEVPDPTPEPTPVAVPKAHKAPKVKAKRVSSIGVGYRETQRFVALWRSEDRQTMPCKNAGWDNIEENIQFILDQPRFWSWASTEHGQSALAALGVAL